MTQTVIGADCTTFGEAAENCQLRGEAGPCSPPPCRKQTPEETLAPVEKLASRYLQIRAHLKSGHTLGRPHTDDIRAALRGSMADLYQAFGPKQRHALAALIAKQDAELTGSSDAVGQ